MTDTPAWQPPGMQKWNIRWYHQHISCRTGRTGRTQHQRDNTTNNNNNRDGWDGNYHSKQPKARSTKAQWHSWIFAEHADSKPFGGSERWCQVHQIGGDTSFRTGRIGNFTMHKFDEGFWLLSKPQQITTIQSAMLVILSKLILTKEKGSDGGKKEAVHELPKNMHGKNVCSHSVHHAILDTRGDEVQTQQNKLHFSIQKISKPFYCNKNDKKAAGVNVITKESNVSLTGAHHSVFHLRMCHTWI